VAKVREKSPEEEADNDDTYTLFEHRGSLSYAMTEHQENFSVEGYCSSFDCKGFFYKQLTITRSLVNAEYQRVGSVSRERRSRKRTGQCTSDLLLLLVGGESVYSAMREV